MCSHSLHPPFSPTKKKKEKEKKRKSRKKRGRRKNLFIDLTYAALALLDTADSIRSINELIRFKNTSWTRRKVGQTFPLDSTNNPFFLCVLYIAGPLESVTRKRRGRRDSIARGTLAIRRSCAPPVFFFLSLFSPSSFSIFLCTYNTASSIAWVVPRIPYEEGRPCVY